jgi:hypothetical protein
VRKPYVFRNAVLRDVLAFLCDPAGDGLFLTGPTGPGKTARWWRKPSTVWRMMIPLGPVVGDAIEFDPAGPTLGITEGIGRHDSVPHIWRHTRKRKAP